MDEVAIDMQKGEIVWQVAHGETPDNVRNNPALKGLTIPRTGRPGRIGVLTTKTLVIAGEGGFFTAPNGQRGAMFRAYNKATGKEVGAVYLPAPQTGSPVDRSRTTSYARSPQGSAPTCRAKSSRGTPS